LAPRNEAAPVTVTTRPPGFASELPGAPDRDEAGAARVPGVNDDLRFGRTMGYAFYRR
jgi:hypothetical protein